MSGALPEYLDLTKAGHAPIRWSGDLELASLQRLSEALADGSSRAHVDLQVFEEGGRKVIRGKVQAELSLTCQRCFGRLQYPVTADFNLAWVRGMQEASRLPAAYDALSSVTGRVKLNELIEDELLLALPMVARHAQPEECTARIPGSVKQQGTTVSVATSKPFAILRVLKRH